MIQVEDLSFKYPNNNTAALNKLNFKIESGEIFGFLGPSGAGKSTTQKILYKILNDYQGLVSIDGKNLKEIDHTYKERIGVCFELPNHYLKLTGKENLDLFAAFYKTNKERNLELLFEKVDLLEAMNKPVETYSKGMKMRLNYIRSIQHNPDILFFDEPTSGLDPVNAQKVKDHILELKAEGKTIFITTHDMHTADALCDMVSFIINGELVTTDTPKRLKSQYGKEMVNVELKNGEIKDFPLKELGINAAFLQFINQKEINRINTLEASLQEVFIKITGQSLQL